MEKYFYYLQKQVKRYQDKFAKKPRLAAFKIAWWSFKSIFVVSFPKRSELKPYGGDPDSKKSTSDIYVHQTLDEKYPLKIAFFMNAALGDTVVLTNYLVYFKRFLKEVPFIMDIYASRSELLISMLPQELISKNIRVIQRDDFNINHEEYHIAMGLIRYPLIVFYNKIILKKIAPQLLLLVEASLNFYATYGKDVVGFSLAESINNQRFLIQGHNRVQSVDLDNLMNVSRDYIFTPFIKVCEDKTLEKFNLAGKRFITVNRGWDSYYKNLKSHMKVWSVEQYNELLCLIKAKYPEYLIVQLGSNPKICVPLDSVDINLIAQTTLEELKVLLKNSVMHIDCEGGLVHLRQVLTNNPALVMFGPTDPKVLAYENNINLWPDGCALPCEWLSSNWMKQCIKTGGGQCERLLNLKPSTVMEYVAEYLGKLHAQ